MRDFDLTPMWRSTIGFDRTARLRRADVPCECLLIGVELKWAARRQNDEIDPFRTSATN